ncbi:MAG: 30S ribosomal protein S6 [Gemmatimonadota bacterium]|nr:30S ribosomal protein S6 [Gemmatimonadota bacterium]MDH5803737.1 30S ribosomal protein S6 [Gemmatimonadota bacterium]
MPRRYEIVYIFDSAMEEAKVKESLERFHKLITDTENASPVTGSSHWGKRSLAYPISGREIGYYVVEQFATDPKLLGEFERALKLDQEVLRYQIIVNEGEAPRPPREPKRDDDDDDDDDAPIIRKTDDEPEESDD